jgi:hypothetical protein
LKWNVCSCDSKKDDSINRLSMFILYDDAAAEAAFLCFSL